MLIIIIKIIMKIMNTLSDGGRPCATPSITWHSHGAVLIRSAPDAQLPVAVVAPALDPASHLDRARVKSTQGDGGGGDAWGHGGWCIIYNNFVL